jgi:hypothetical protein
VGNVIAPYDEHVRRAITKGMKALVVLRNRGGLAGQGMYYVSGGDQLDLTIPVVEVYQLKSRSNRVEDALRPEGIEVSLWPTENKWKKANDVTSFQVAGNVILSAMELAIFVIGMFRIHQWTRSSCSRLFSIGPVCIILEMISAVLRFTTTVVDPFFTFRIIPATFGLVIVTASIPFLLCSGILLTFFWAETLRASRIQASPFIAEYKKSAFVVITILFLGEAITAGIRAGVPVTGNFNPATLAQAFYAVVAIALIVCYLLCAHQIRVRLATGSNAKRKTYIRAMNIRFALSTIGYASFICCLVGSIPLFYLPWGWKIILNLMNVSLNFSGLLQVYSLQPAQGGGKSHSNSTPLRTDRSKSVDSSILDAGKSSADSSEP